ncbi:MAG: bacterial transcriptional activator domain-containing protein [Rubrivivax sp.]
MPSRGKREEAPTARGAAALLRRGLDAALANPENGREDLRAALSAFTAHGDAAGRLVAATALLQLIGIADDDYTGFEIAVDAALDAHAALAAIDGAEHRLVAQTGLLIAGWFQALDDPLLPAQADALTRALSDESLRASVRCCAGLTALAYHVARFNLEGVLWVELMMRPVLAVQTLPQRLAAEWRHALVQGRYECGGADTAEALRGAVDPTATAATEPAVALKRLLAEAQNAIGEGQLDAGDAALAQCEPLLSPRAPRPASWWHLLRSRQALAAGHPRGALVHAQLALRLVGESQLPARWTGVTLMQPGQVHVAAGNHAQALPYFERAGAAAAGEQADFCWCLAHFVRALDGFSNGASDDAARTELQQGFAIARRLNWLHFFRASPRMAAQVCGLGLEHGIETAFVQEVIAARGLDAVRPDLSAWPWPVRIHTLGRFGIEIDGAALAFAGKVAKKPLELLQFTIASGGSEVSTATVMFALWRELDGDKAKSAFNVALHRLRKLLGHDDALVLEVGRLSLEPKSVWVDCLAFEQLVDSAFSGAAVTLSPRAATDLQRAVTLYTGHYLHDTEDEAWQLAYRSRLASKFKRSVLQLARHGIANRQRRQVRMLLERALELEPTAEDLARELMQMLLEDGERAAALRVFEQCRASIDQGFGVRPSAATLALRERVLDAGG